METGCVLIDRQEHRWGLKIEEQVGGWGWGEFALDFSMALRQEFPLRGKGFGHGEIAQS